MKFIQQKGMQWFVGAMFVSLVVVPACGSSDPHVNENSGGTGGSSNATSSSSAMGGGGVGGMGGSGTGGNGGAPTNSPTTCKRGVAYGYHSKADMTALSPSIAWWYNWTDVPDDGVKPDIYKMLGVEYAPMVWGSIDDAKATQIANEIPSDTYFLLGFNEPNFGGQANLSATQAAALWPKLESIAAAKNLALVSPAVNFCGGSCQETDPFKYLDDFFAACENCKVDAIAIHIYVSCQGDGNNKAQWLLNHVETYKTRFDKPIWLTEFACDNAGSLAEQKAFMLDAVKYLENEPRIARYAWFSGRTNNVANANLLGDDGVLTELGQAYVDAPRNACK